MQESDRITRNHPSNPFPKGNKLGPGGKREGAGRKSRKEIEDKRTAAEIAKTILEASVKEIARRYVQRAIAPLGSDQILAKAMDKILPDEINAIVPTLSINFVMFNSGSATGNHTDDSSSGNPSTPIDITPPHAPIVAPITPHDAPRLTFTDIVEK